jgi:hypothetical protein
MESSSRSYGPDDLRREETFGRLKECWHREIAVTAGLHYCRKYKWDAPAWLVSEAAMITFSFLIHQKSGKRGRSSGPLERFSQDMIDYDRYSAVCEMRDNQPLIRKEVSELKAIRRVRVELLREREKVSVWAGRSWLRAYQCAAMLLQDTDSFAKEDAIARSYKKVNKALQNPKERTRYHLFESDFLEKLGIRVGIVAQRGRKFVPIHERAL